ncbi:MAG: hypothetical protein FD118_4279, partial [Rhodocyclaceae bacterium]
MLVATEQEGDEETAETTLIDSIEDGEAEADKVLVGDVEKHLLPPQAESTVLHQTGVPVTVPPQVGQSAVTPTSTTGGAAITLDDKMSIDEDVVYVQSKQPEVVPGTGTSEDKAMKIKLRIRNIYPRDGASWKLPLRLEYMFRRA